MKFRLPGPCQKTARFAVLAAASALLMAACASQPSPPAVDPDAVRAKIRGLMPARVANAESWAIDIFAAFEFLGVPADLGTHLRCAGCHRTGIELPGGSAGARPSRHRASRNRSPRDESSHPQTPGGAALELHSPDGLSYGERLDRAKTEQDLSELFEDFIRGCRSANVCSATGIPCEREDRCR